METLPSEPGGPEFTDVVARAIAQLDPSLEKRLGTDPQAHLDLVVLTHRAHDEVGELLRSAVVAARSACWSWEAIGRSLGMSRQAAQQRFNQATTQQSETDQGGDNRRLVGLTAMREMEELNAWGQHGWHSVGYGPMFHDLECSSMKWEHRRVVVGSRAARNLERAGWDRIGAMWFPWMYFKRDLDERAEPGEPRVS